MRGWCVQCGWAVCGSAGALSCWEQMCVWGFCVGPEEGGLGRGVGGRGAVHEGSTLKVGVEAVVCAISRAHSPKVVQGSE